MTIHQQTAGDLATTSRVIPHHERRMMVDTQELEKLQGIARQCRRDIVKMVHHAGSGHPAGSLSAIDILVVLYFRHMNIRTEEPQWRERDMFFLSKGHCTPAYYSVLAARGYFNHDELMTFRDLGTRLQGHPSNTHLESTPHPVLWVKDCRWPMGQRWRRSTTCWTLVTTSCSAMVRSRRVRCGRPQ